MSSYYNVTILFCNREAQDKIKDICLFEILKAFLIGSYYNVTIPFCYREAQGQNKGYLPV